MPGMQAICLQPEIRPSFYANRTRNQSASPQLCILRFALWFSTHADTSESPPRSI